MNFNKNKEIIYRKLYEMKNHPTAEEILIELKKEYPNLGIATIYRNLANLIEEKRIIKIESNSFKDRFDATIENHYHAECSVCGKIKDIKAHITYEIENNIKVNSIEVKIKYICNGCL